MTRFLFALFLISCSRPELPEVYQKELGSVDLEEGKRLTFSFGCGVCHQIGGINDHPGDVAMSLVKWKERKFISGNLANNPLSLVEWLKNPQKFEPDTAMPNLGISEEQAKKIAGFLYTQ